MARYIDADLLLERLNKKKSEVAKARYTEGFNDAIMRVKSMISTAPVVDVAPKSEVVREVINEIDDRLYDMAMAYRESEHLGYYAVCEMVHHKVIRAVEKKYTGKGITNE